MQIIKMDPLIQDATPREVVTPLGEPLYKLSPVVATINNNEGDTLEEITLDGSEGANTKPLKDITLPSDGSTPAGTATLGKSEHGSYINIKNAVFNNSTPLQKGVDTLVVIEYEVLSGDNYRILSEGNDLTLNFTLETTVTSVNGIRVAGTPDYIGIGKFVYVTPASLDGINKTAILLAGENSKVVHNGVVFDLESMQPRFDGTLSVNGSGKTKVTSLDANYYSLAVYQKDIPSLDEIIEFTKP